MLLLTAGAYTWEYTNSPEFCGTSCHTMPPEYTSYLVSPHARIDCVDCHIGKGFIATRITRKAGDVKHVIATAFQTYEFPIRAKDLRPARETCERCHFPEKFSDDSLREIKRYHPDVENTPYSIYLVLKTGGGSKRLGLGQGIHWHIENPVYYFTDDPLEQDIPYVRVVNDDGSIVEYLELGSTIDPSEIEDADLKEMDCITCHNRITHMVFPPEDTIDQLLARGIISAEIPEIRARAIEVYSGLYETTEIGMNGIAGLHNTYYVLHNDFYRDNQEKIQAAVDALQEAYGMSVFPEQNSNWLTHPNNIGHKDSPGCLRCHSGKHLNQEGEAIRLECNLCHSIPVVASAADFIANIEISRGPEPQSHLNPNWISLHHLAFDATCANCHSTQNPGGDDNSSFCSNPACHGTVWEYAGFDAPGLREILLAQLPPTPTPTPEPEIETPQAEAETLSYSGAIRALLQTRCAACHGPSGALKGFNVTSYASLMEGGESGAAIQPGEPEQSLLVKVQTGAQAHFGQFTPSELAQIREWIAAGAPEE